MHDGGVYLLKTSDGYRYGYLENINRIYGKFDVERMKYDLIPNVVYDTFGASDVYNDKTSALFSAIEFAESLNMELEDGVGYVIDDAEYKSFVEIIHG